MKTQFAITPCLRVVIDHDAGDTMTQDFLRWVIDERIPGFRGGSIGPEGLIKYLDADQAEKVRAWFEARGVSEDE